ncbi:sulfotransferase family protein [Novosphingobium soli]|uniref:Sulfotransferase n=1 Tax=Novosphingobium soli TaxID=574956 RepID=A0ABV6CT53_9SPHN
MQHHRSSGTTGMNRLIASAFGVRLVSDVPERLALSAFRYRPNGARRERLDAVRRRGTLFIHVPKNAGTSICERLYGCQIKHETVRYYAMVAPDLLELPSFAIVRDPVCRFLSAFAYARAGGTADRDVSLPFRPRYRAFSGIDQAIDHLACARSPFDIDHIFRPQAWYLLDAHGACRVEHLVPFEEIDRLEAILDDAQLAALPRLNRSRAEDRPELTPSQEAFVQTFYAADYALRHKALLTSPSVRPRSAHRATP